MLHPSGFVSPGASKNDVFIKHFRTGLKRSVSSGLEGFKRLFLFLLWPVYKASINNTIKLLGRRSYSLGKKRVPLLNGLQRNR